MAFKVSFYLLYVCINSNYILLTVKGADGLKPWIFTINIPLQPCLCWQNKLSQNIFFSSLVVFVPKLNRAISKVLKGKSGHSAAMLSKLPGL